jgi:hypothetical protein
VLGYGILAKRGLWDGSRWTFLVSLAMAKRFYLGFDVFLAWHTLVSCCINTLSILGPVLKRFFDLLFCFCIPGCPGRIQNIILLFPGNFTIYHCSSSDLLTGIFLHFFFHF